jgi:hypothetical protein
MRELDRHAASPKSTTPVTQLDISKDIYSKHPDASQHHSGQHISTKCAFAMIAALTAELFILRPMATFLRRLPAAT